MNDVIAKILIFGFIVWSTGGVVFALDNVNKVKRKPLQLIAFTLTCGPASWFLGAVCGLIAGAIWLFDKSMIGTKVKNWMYE